MPNNLLKINKSKLQNLFTGNQITSIRIEEPLKYEHIFEEITSTTMDVYRGIGNLQTEKAREQERERERLQNQQPLFKPINEELQQTHNTRKDSTHLTIFGAKISLVEDRDL